MNNEHKLEILSNASGTSLSDSSKQHPVIKRTKSFKAVSKLAFIRKPKLVPKSGRFVFTLDVFFPLLNKSIILILIKDISLNVMKKFVRLKNQKVYMKLKYIIYL